MTQENNVLTLLVHLMLMRIETGLKIRYMIHEAYGATLECNINLRFKTIRTTKA